MKTEGKTPAADVDATVAMVMVPVPTELPHAVAASVVVEPVDVVATTAEAKRRIGPETAEAATVTAAVTTTRHGGGSP